MLSSRAGSVLVLVTLLALVGCPHPPPPPPPPVTVVALVTPSYDPTTGYGVQQLALPDQILEWRTLYATAPGNYRVRFTSGNPCAGTPDHLDGSPSSPAQCTVGPQSSGQYLFYSYVIEKPPTGIGPRGTVTPCNGCSYLVGPSGPTAAVPSSASAPLAGAPAAGLPKAAASGNPGQINLSCAGGSITANPTPQSSTDNVFWQADSTILDWQVTLDPVSGSQKALCQGGQTQFSGANSLCEFNADASGCYTYKVASGCSATPGNGTIAVGSAACPAAKKKH